jgi:hypothetical protein
MAFDYSSEERVNLSEARDPCSDDMEKGPQNKRNEIDA